MEIINVRIDEQFPQTSSILTWVDDLAIDQIIFADDEQGTTEVALADFGSCTATKISAKAVLEKLQSSELVKKKILLVLKNPQTLKILVENGFGIKEVTLASLSKKKDYKRITFDVFVSEEEKVVFLDLEEKGISFYVQPFPSDIKQLVIFNKTLRMGIIGTNAISHRFMAAALDCYGFALTAVYSRNLATAQEFASKYGTASCYEDFSAFVASDEIDAVYVASPNALHYPQTMALLEAGKHVLCEKPMASNYFEVKAMQDKAKEKSLVLLEAVRPTFSQVYQKAKELLPTIGTIRRMAVSFHQYSSRYDKFKQGIIENAFNPDLSNSSLMDLGCYCVQWMVGLFGSPQSIFSQSIKMENGFEGQGTFIAKYDGFIAEVSYSKIAQGYLPTVIEGEKASLITDHPTQSRVLKLKTNEGETTTWDFNVPEEGFLAVLEPFIRFTNSTAGIEVYDKISIEAVKVLDEVRKQQDIVFPADKIISS